MLKLDNQSAHILKYIYKHPYRSFSELRAHFKSIHNFDDIIISNLNPYISFRSESSIETDQGYEVLSLVSGFIVCNQKGKIYIESIQSTHYKNIIEWVRYIITTSIALAAFIKSFFF